MKKFLCWMLGGMLVHALPLWAAAQQSHAEIREIVAAFARAQTSGLPGQVTIKVGEIDRRLVQPACPTLQAFLPPGGQLLGNATIGVRCAAGKSWTLFVPVQIKVTANLLIANKPLQIGQVIRAEDISTQSGDLIQTGILTDPELAIGKVLKLSIGAGQVLKQDMLRPPYAVTQGQTVQLQVMGAGFSIRSEGQALNNAAEGQPVRAKTTSGQVVSGTARLGGIVEIRP